MAFLPTTLHRLSGNGSHLPSQEGPKSSMGWLRMRDKGSGKEDHKDDEDNGDEEDVDHEPLIGGNRLEVLEDL